MHLVETNQNHNQRRVWFAYVALLLMNIIDLVYTDITISTNVDDPFLSQLYYEQFGAMGISAVKVLFLGMIGFIINSQHSQTFYRNLFYLFVAAYGAMTVYHTYWFFG
jgi:uncharacterized membrane protein YiaA